MPTSPESQPLVPEVQERPDEFNVPNELKSEMKAIETNAKTNISVNSSGQPVITTGNAQSAKIQLPGDKKSLIAKTKGSITNAATWLYAYLLRMFLKKEANASPGSE